MMSQQRGHKLLQQKAKPWLVLVERRWTWYSRQMLRVERHREMRKERESQWELLVLGSQVAPDAVLHG